MHTYNVLTNENFLLCENIIYNDNDLPIVCDYRGAAHLPISPYDNIIRMV